MKRRTQNEKLKGGDKMNEYFKRELFRSLSSSSNILRAAMEDVEKLDDSMGLRRINDMIEYAEMSIRRINELLRNWEILRERESAKTLDVKEALSILKQVYDNEEIWQDHYETLIFDPANKEITISFRDGIYVRFEISEACGYDGGFYEDNRKVIQNEASGQDHKR